MQKQEYIAGDYNEYSKYNCKKDKKFEGGKSKKEIELEYLKEHGLKLGEKVDIFTDYPFDSLYPGLITVGSNVTISSNVRILAHDASMGYITGGACKIGVVEIGNDVFIGHGAIILCNTKIGDNSIIGAGSVVSGTFPKGSVIAGNPAKVIKTTDEFKKQHLNDINDHPTFERPWREWSEIKEDEWNEIRCKLKNQHGYIIRNREVIK